MSTLSLGSLSPEGRPRQVPVGVIDIGSNSVRMVVYEGAVPAAAPMFNEKALCGLGRGLGETGRLDPAGVKHALRTLERFDALARAMGVGRLIAVATAAVRDAENGIAFTDAVTERIGKPVRVLSGAEEARLSALGVLAGAPDAEGVVGDLGGGSLELVAVEHGRVGDNVTLPVGPFRIEQQMRAGAAAATQVIDQALEQVPWLGAVRGAELHAVGGAWRALARVHMAQAGYPLKVLHGYDVPGPEMAKVAEAVARQTRKSLRRLEGVPVERLETLPAAALVMARLIRVLAPTRLLFSAYGLREGLLHELLEPDERQADPLLAAARRIADGNARFPAHADELMVWLEPLFPGEPTPVRRLRLAASLLSDIGWYVHPDYRPEHAMLDLLRMPLVAVTHAERVELALMLHARYTGGTGGSAVTEIRRVLARERAEHARRVGLALRLAHTFSGGVPGLLGDASLEIDERWLTLTLRHEATHLLGDVVERRFEALAKAFGREPRLLLAP